MLTKTRLKKYQELKKRASNTQLVQYKGGVPNNNKILIKKECDNPFGSHYDRVYIDLFKYHEELGNIKPGDKILETTSGTAGVSFAGIGKSLGFECYVALPAGGEKAREKAIKRELTSSDHLILTPSKNYISGFPTFLKKFLTQHKDYFFLNHSMGKRDSKNKLFTNNEITLNALEQISKELSNEKIDYFIPAVGNGSNILGVGRGLTNTKIIGFETFQSAVAFEQIYPGQYKNKYGIIPGTLKRHNLPGTSYQGIDFPHIRTSVNNGLIKDVILISDTNIDEEYELLTGKKETKKLIHWDKKLKYHKDLGRTTKAALLVALQLAKKVKGKNFLIIAYDKAQRYDT